MVTLIAIAVAYGLDLFISAITGASANATLVAIFPPVGLSGLVAFRGVVTDITTLFHLRFRVAATHVDQIGQIAGGLGRCAIAADDHRHGNAKDCRSPE